MARRALGRVGSRARSRSARPCGRVQKRRQAGHSARQLGMHHAPRVQGGQHGPRIPKAVSAGRATDRRAAAANQREDEAVSHNIEDLRERLFAALDGLADNKKPMEVERAKAIADVARVIVDSAKAEISLLHATGARHVSTEFIPLASAPRQLSAGGCPSCGGRLKRSEEGRGGKEWRSR